jgi:hypothetical protein
MVDKSNLADLPRLYSLQISSEKGQTSPEFLRIFYLERYGNVEHFDILPTFSLCPS